MWLGGLQSLAIEKLNGVPSHCCVLPISSGKNRTTGDRLTVAVGRQLRLLPHHRASQACSEVFFHRSRSHALRWNKIRGFTAAVGYCILLYPIVPVLGLSCWAPLGLQTPESRLSRHWTSLSDVQINGSERPVSNDLQLIATMTATHRVLSLQDNERFTRPRRGYVTANDKLRRLVLFLRWYIIIIIIYSSSQCPSWLKHGWN